MRALLVLVLLALLTPAAAEADPAAALYDPDAVAQVDLSLTPAAIAALRDQPREYADATLELQVAGQTLGPFAIQARLKGNASFRTIDGKAAFRLKLPKGQRPFGLKGLTLNNMLEDPSGVHETLAHETFRALGVPGPRTGYAYVRLNGEPLGLYLDLERYDDVSLPARFASTGHLYEGEYGADATPERRGDLEVDEGDAADQRDLDTLVGATSWAGIAAVADAAELRRFWAVEHLIGFWDGYSVSAEYYTPNNYSLHADAAGRFSLLPGGTDQTFGRRVAFDLPLVGGGILSRRCAADAGCAADYRTAVATGAATMAGLDLPGRVDALAAVTAPWAALPGRESVTPQDRAGEIAATRAFVAAAPGQASAWAADQGATGTDDGPPAGGGGTGDGSAAAGDAGWAAGVAGTGRGIQGLPVSPMTAPFVVAAVTPSASGVAGVSSRMRCVVPGLRGLTLRRARTRLGAAGCRLGRVREVRTARRSHRHRRARVSAVHPSRGTRLAPDAPVRVVVRR